MKDLFQMDCDNLKWEGAYDDDDDDDGADLKDFIVDDDDESWIELNWTNVYSVLKNTPSNITHISQQQQKFTFLTILFIYYITLDQGRYFSPNETIHW